jgi:hypothetical protein
MPIKFIKISYNEEIVADCIEKRKGIFIKDAAIIMSVEQGKLILGTWLPYTNVQDGFFLPEKAYLFAADVQPEFIQYYNKWRTEPFKDDSVQADIEI